MIVWGGYNGVNQLDDGWSYNPATDQWTTISAVNTPSARQNHTAVWTGTGMIVWGGYNGGTRLATAQVTIHLGRAHLDTVIKLKG